MIIFIMKHLQNHEDFLIHFSGHNFKNIILGSQIISLSLEPRYVMPKKLNSMFIT